ncbi:response regulator [Rhodohalobacter sp.]|uniref:response regulator n=1 Tax=Rhodohalobacter sp. TaxID=1974210 RepID=UPI002ACDEBD3|nr:response regulator [Rhodohalobacter sp.]
MNPQVMLVDDDAGVLFLHELMVLESGFSDQITSFYKAETALNDLADQKNQDSEIVIFLDINMPGMSGWDFLKKLESSDFDKGVYIVMVTSSVHSSDRITANNFKHVIDFIEKPLNLEICEKLKGHESLKHLFTDDR